MPTRRSRGDGGLYWDRSRKRWIAEVTIGYTASGKRMVRKASGTTKTVAQRKLKEIIRDYEDGLAIAPHNYTVTDAVRDWLSYGLSGRSRATVEKCTILANTHIIPALGARRPTVQVAHVAAGGSSAGCRPSQPYECLRRAVAIDRRAD